VDGSTTPWFLEADYGRLSLLAWLRNPPGWRRDALCKEYPLSWFFPLRGEDAEKGKAVCCRCAVQAECLSFAMSDPDARHVGIWGATSARERRKLSHGQQLVD
jgi:WhiB family redox-sensing transcriptional regulator